MNPNQSPIIPALAPAHAHAPVPPAQQPFPAPAPIARRKKTCPHCRALVRERPVEVWMIKDMVGAVVRSGLAEADSIPSELLSDDNNNGSSSTSTQQEFFSAAVMTDPWKDIFPTNNSAGARAGLRGPEAEALAAVMIRENMGMLDEEDMGIYRCVECAHEIWDGVCSHCARVYPGHRLNAYGADLDVDDDDDDDDDEDLDNLGGEVGFWDRWFPPRYFESEDEDDEDDFSDDDEEEVEVDPRTTGTMRLSGVRRIVHHETDSEEEYESSFIDDDDDDDDEEEGAEGDHSDSEEEQDHDLDDDGEFHLSVRGVRHFHPRVVTSDDELGDADEENVEDLEEDTGPLTSGRLRHRIVESDDEDDEDQAT